MSVTISGTTGISLVQDSTITPAKISGTRQLLQSVTYQTGAVATGTTLIPFDNTIPQITEGDQYMSLSVTPLSTTSTLEVSFNALVSSSAINSIIAALFRDSTTNAIATTYMYLAAIGGAGILTGQISLVSGSLASTTFKLRIGAAGAGTTTFNGGGGVGAIFGGTISSYITIKEYAA